MYNERKAAQVAAFFTAKQGGTIFHLKLMKLMYLAERASISTYGDSMLDDILVSLPHGPILSITKDCMDGICNRNLEDGWESWISDKANHMVSLNKDNFSENCLDELSISDLEILNLVWAEHGKKTQWELVDFTHDQCGEWSDPNGSNYPIEYEDVLIAQGRNQELAREVGQKIKERQRIEKVLHSL